MSMDEADKEFFRAWKQVPKERRKLFGVECPKCKEVRPRAYPSILLPGQRCKVDGYRDPRQRLTEEEEDSVWEKCGFYRKDK